MREESESEKRQYSVCVRERERERERERGYYVTWKKIKKLQDVGHLVPWNLSLLHSSSI